MAVIEFDGGDFNFLILIETSFLWLLTFVDLVSLSGGSSLIFNEVFDFGLGFSGGSPLIFNEVFDFGLGLLLILWPNYIGS